MNKSLVTLSLFFALFLCSTQSGISQQINKTDERGKKNAIKVNPFGFLIPFLSSYNISYERKLNDSNSVAVGFNYVNFDLISIEYKSYGIKGEYRFYLDEAIKGLYIAPGGSFQYIEDISILSSSTNITFTSGSADATAGYQFILGDDFVIDLGIGLSFRTGFGNNVDANFNGFVPTGFLQIGYHF